MCPYELLGRTKALVSQSHCCVDDVFTVTAHYYKPRAGERGISQTSVFSSIGMSKQTNYLKS